MFGQAKRSWSHVRSAGLMCGGTVLVGAAGYAFVALAGHCLPAAEAAALSSFYLLVNIIGPGLFVALEQETNRVTSSALATASSLSVVRRAAVHGAMLLAVVLFVLGLISPLLVDRSLLGHWELLPAIMVSAVSAAAVYLVRGVLGGMQEFDGYAATLAGEGLMRLLPALALAAGGIASTGLYGFVFALGSGVGAIAALRWLRLGRPGQLRFPAMPPDRAPGLEPGPAELDAGRVRGLAPLVGATLLAQVVANLAPIVVTARLTSDIAVAAAFASAFILARVPLFVFSPLQAVVLPAVARAFTQGDKGSVQRIVRPVLLATAGIGIVGTGFLITAGPWAIHTLFGAKAPISATVLGFLGVSTLLLIVAQILQAALVAVRAHLAVTVSWQISTVVLIAVLMVPINPVHAAVFGQVAASAAVVTAMTASLIAQQRGVPAVSPVSTTSS